MKIIYLLPFLLLLHTSFGQGFGYYGKKNSFTVTGNFEPKFFANLVGSRSPINGARYGVGYGFTASYDRQLNANQFIGVEFSMNYGSAKLTGVEEVYVSGYDSYSYMSIASDLSALKYRVMSPCFTYSTAYKGHISPIGIVHTFGVGALILQVSDERVDGNQSVQVDSYYSGTSVMPINTKGQLVNKELYGHRMYGARVFWQTALNVPLAKGVMWTISARANVNVYTSLLIIEDSSDYYYHATYDRNRRQIAFTELLNVLQFSSGFKFVL